MDAAPNTLTQAAPNDGAAATEPVTRARFSELSDLCPACGWLMRVHRDGSQHCTRCDEHAHEFRPLTRVERLFLAAQLVESTRQSYESDPAFWKKTLFSHYVGRSRNANPYGFTSGTSSADLLDVLAREAQAWRDAGCPV